MTRVPATNEGEEEGRLLGGRRRAKGGKAEQETRSKVNEGEGRGRLATASKRKRSDLAKRRVEAKDEGRRRKKGGRDWRRRGLDTLPGTYRVVRARYLLTEEAVYRWQHTPKGEAWR